MNDILSHSNEELFFKPFAVRVNYINGLQYEEYDGHIYSYC